MRPRSAGLLPGSASTRETCCASWVTTTAPSTRWSPSAAFAWPSDPEALFATRERLLDLRRGRRNRSHRDIRRDSPPISLSPLDTFKIGLRIVANTNAVSDGPIQARRQQNVSAGKLVTHQERPPICQRHLNVS